MPPISIWLVVLALMAVHLAGTGSYYAVPVLAPAMSPDVGLPASLAGFNTSFAYCGALITGPFASALILRFGGVRVSQVGLVVCGCGLALAAFGVLPMLIASAITLGIGHGPVTPAGSHILAGRVPARRRSFIFSIKQTGVPAGAMLAGAVLPLIVLVGGWRGALLAMSAFCVLVALALQPVRARLDADRRPGMRIRLGDISRTFSLWRGHVALRRVVGSGCALGAAQFCFGSFFTTLQVEVLGYSLVAAGFNLSAGQLGGIVGRVFWGVVADRTGAPRLTMAALCFLAAGCCALLALAGPGWPVWAVTATAVLSGFTSIGWNGVQLAEVARLAPPGQVGAATALNGFVFSFAMLFTPSGFSGLVGYTGGYGLGYALCAAVCVAAGLWMIPAPPLPAHMQPIPAEPGPSQR